MCRFWCWIERASVKEALTADRTPSKHAGLRVVLTEGQVGVAPVKDTLVAKSMTNEHAGIMGWPNRGMGWLWVLQ